MTGPRGDTSCRVNTANPLCCDLVIRHLQRPEREREREIERERKEAYINFGNGYWLGKSEFIFDQVSKSGGHLATHRR